MKKKELKLRIKTKENEIVKLVNDIEKILNDDWMVKEKYKKQFSIRKEYERQILSGTRKLPEKPPLGVIPKKICQEKRHKDLNDAIKRYKDAGLEVPKEWIEESEHLSDKLKEKGYFVKVSILPDDEFRKTHTHFDVNDIGALLEKIKDEDNILKSLAKTSLCSFFKEAIVKKIMEYLSKSNSLTKTDLLLSILDDISRIENNH